MSRTPLAIVLVLLMVGTAITNGVSNSIEEVESLDKKNPNRFSHTGMNQAGFQVGSVFTDTSLALGGIGYHACAILDNSSLKCWGGGDWGQLGTGGSQSEDYPTTVDLGVGRSALAVAAGYRHTCAILDDTSLKCWGANGFGEVGIGVSSLTPSYEPESVNLGNRIAVTLSLGGHHTCAIMDDASVKCWGWNGYGQLGIGTVTDQHSPTTVNLGFGRDAVALASGYYHTCAILDDGSVMCWGGGYQGQLGIGIQCEINAPCKTTPTPVDLGTGRKAVALAAGFSHTCVILDDASMMCWGSNSNGQLGVDQDWGPPDGCDPWMSQKCLSPATVGLNTSGGNETPIAVDAGSSHTCAIFDNGDLKCWGWNGYGQLGTSTQWSSQFLPTLVSFGGSSGTNSFPIAISLNDKNTCAIMDNRSLMCWGANGLNGFISENNHRTPASIDLGLGHHMDISERDLDGDGVINIFDTNIAGDSDGDGVLDGIDAYPGNAARSIACSVGQFGRHWCDDSTPGHFVPAPGYLGQTNCDAGYNQPLSGSSSCILNEPGYYTSQPGTADPIPCPVGTAMPNTGATNCLLSPSGTYVNTTGATGATSCPIGYYQPYSGQSSCYISDPGHYSNGLAQIFQTKCYAGTYQPDYGQTSCIDTDPGYYSPDAAISQIPCSVGTFAPTSLMASCISSDPGHYVSQPMQTEQTPCSPGTYQPLRGSANCLPSPEDTFVDGFGATIPTDCPVDTRQPEVGQTLCIELDSDGDGIGDITDIDDDNDGIPDIDDLFKYDPNEWSDNDGDGIGDNADLDDDDDGFPDIDDDFPYDETEWIDTDSDGVGNNADEDDDDDGMPDVNDAFPLNPMEWEDGDRDGVGDNADEDDDNDGWSDIEERRCDSNQYSYGSQPFDFDDDGICDKMDADIDGDGFSNILETILLENPRSADEHPSLSSPIVRLIIIIPVMLVTYRRREQIYTTMDNIIDYFEVPTPSQHMIGIKKGKIEWLIFNDLIWTRNISQLGDPDEWQMKTDIFVPERRMVGVIDKDGREYLLRYGVLWVRRPNDSWSPLSFSYRS